MTGPGAGSHAPPELSTESKLLGLLATGQVRLAPSSVRPWTVELDLTNRCPLRCSFCRWSARESAPELSEELLEGLPAALSHLGVRGLIITGGGEPLLHPGLAAAVERAAGLGLAVGLYTNGVPLQRQVAARIIPQLTWVRLNLPAATPVQFASITGGTAAQFEQILAAARLLRLIRGAQAAPRLGVGAVLTQTAPGLIGDRIRELARMTHTLEFDFLQLKHDLRQLGEAATETWWAREVVPGAAAAQAELPERPILISTARYARAAAPGTGPGQPPRWLPEPCHVAGLGAAVLADGRVVGCRLLRDDPSAIIGDLREQPLEEILTGPRRTAWLERIADQGCTTGCGHLHLNRRLHASLALVATATPDLCFL